MCVRNKTKSCTGRRNPFYLIIWNAAMNGEVTAYVNDSLTSIKTPEDVLKEVSIETTVMIPNPDNPDDPYDLVPTTVSEVYEPSKIVKYRLMEDWIFDYNYSDFRARIIAIAPLWKPNYRVWTGIRGNSNLLD